MISKCLGVGWNKDSFEHDNDHLISKKSSNSLHNLDNPQLRKKQVERIKK